MTKIDVQCIFNWNVLGQNVTRHTSATMQDTVEGQFQWTAYRKICCESMVNQMINVYVIYVWLKNTLTRCAVHSNIVAAILCL